MRWLVLLVSVIGVGVASRLPPLRSIPLVGKELGDVLWAVMFYAIILLIRPTTRPIVAGAISLFIAGGTELSQRYDASWINALRDTRLGGLLLGRHFRWEDMACFVVGSVAAATTHAILRRRSARPVHP
jgi:hypothetical protein